MASEGQDRLNQLSVVQSLPFPVHEIRHIQIGPSNEVLPTSFCRGRMQGLEQLSHLAHEHSSYTELELELRVSLTPKPMLWPLCLADGPGDQAEPHGKLTVFLKPENDRHVT